MFSVYFSYAQTVAFFFLLWFLLIWKSVQWFRAQMLLGINVCAKPFSLIPISNEILYLTKSKSVVMTKLLEKKLSRTRESFNLGENENILNIKYNLPYNQTVTINCLVMNLKNIHSFTVFVQENIPNTVFQLNCALKITNANISSEW